MKTLPGRTIISHMVAVSLLVVFHSSVGISSELIEDEIEMEVTGGGSGALSAAEATLDGCYEETFDPNEYIFYSRAENKSKSDMVHFVSENGRIVDADVPSDEESTLEFVIRTDSNLVNVIVHGIRDVHTGELKIKEYFPAAKLTEKFDYCG
ncbi:MAG: hypothetical protein GY762_13285 [Proteobacteria bacterium]|nr:hypothetical protein [Pseudomonadota bacterium]